MRSDSWTRGARSESSRSQSFQRDERIGAPRPSRRQIAGGGDHEREDRGDRSVDPLVERTDAEEILAHVRESAAEIARPGASPMATTGSPWPTIKASIVEGRAPRATRTAISCRRRLTTQAVTP